MPLGGCAQREEEIPKFIMGGSPFYGYHHARAAGRTPQGCACRPRQVRGLDDRAAVAAAEKAANPNMNKGGIIIYEYYYRGPVMNTHLRSPKELLL